MSTKRACEVLERRKEFLMPCLNYFYTKPPLFVRANMQYLYDDTGKRYLDFFAGVSVMNCGHCNPAIIDRVAAQMKTLQHLTNIYITEPVVKLAQRLAAVLPGDLHNSFFCMSGSEANEGAMLLARIATGKRKFIARKSGLHGRTELTMAATGIPMWRADPFLQDDFYFADTKEEIEAILEKDGDIAAFISETIQGNAGIQTPEPDYFCNISPLLKKKGVLFIDDEVQTGFARTGTMFAIEQYGVTPDIMTMSKALGNGIPIAAFSTTREIADRFTKPSASTLGGNPVSCAAALAVLDYIQEHDLCRQAERLGKELQCRLLALKEKHDCIAFVRGKGLMIGAELVKPGTGSPWSEGTDFILEALKDRGIILGKNGVYRNVLAFQPPLVINHDDIDYLITNLDEVLTQQASLPAGF
ncbi:MAG: aspartate aminotransferase family protein [Spirochaetaceae bacterium]|jgi:4-aminobutyrate aminotransferase|nr:aspartate aminotransferase family protein [Spirochaetaceae bacterium]